MAHDITTEAVRLALGMSQLRAEAASLNIARAATPGAQAMQLDFAGSQGLLEAAAHATPGDDAGLRAALAAAAADPAVGSTLAGPVQLDEQVADMATANLTFQSLSESLSRHFGLMRLAITGRN